MRCWCCHEREVVSTGPGVPLCEVCDERAGQLGKEQARFVGYEIPRPSNSRRRWTPTEVRDTVARILAEEVRQQVLRRLRPREDGTVEVEGPELARLKPSIDKIASLIRRGALD